MNRLVHSCILLVLCMAVVAPSVAIAKPEAGEAPEITHYTLSVSVNGGPFVGVASSSDVSDIERAQQDMETDAISEGTKSVTYRNTAWSLVQPIYHLDHTLKWSWIGSTCNLISRGYTPYVYPGAVGWSLAGLSLNSVTAVGTSCITSKYQYRFRYDGTVGGVPFVSFKYLGLQVKGFAGGSSSSTKF